MNRRDFLTASLVGFGVFMDRLVGASGCQYPGTGKSSSASAARRCMPLIAGPLWWYDPFESRRWGIAGWRDELDCQSRIRFNLLWLCNVPAAFSADGDVELFSSLLDLCARRKVRVILDTGTSPSWYTKLDVVKEIELCSTNIARIAERFKDHPAFFAWYVPHEIYVMWGEGARYIDELYPRLVELCKKSADKPVTVSPFFILDQEKIFGDFRYADPEEYTRYWTRLIRRSGFDIVMLQDSGEHFAYVTNDMRKPFFEAMYQACRAAGARMWGNVETAEYDCPSKEEFVRRYGRIHHSQAKGLTWRPVPIDRLREKLDLASLYSEEIVTWGYREFCRPALGESARKWYSDYLAYVRSM